MNGKMKNPTSLSLSEKPQNKHDAPRGIQKDFSNNFATEVAEPVRCVKYLHTQKKKENMKNLPWGDQNLHLNDLPMNVVCCTYKNELIQNIARGKQWRS